MKKIVLLVLMNLSFLIPLAHGQPIRIAYLQSDIHQLPCWVALEKGFFEKEGIQVKVAGIFKAGPELMSGFSAGDLDMGYVGIAPSTTAVANKTARVVALAQVNTEGSAIVVRKEDRIQALSDLMGKTVAVPGHATVQDFLLRKALHQFKIPQEQVKIMVLKPPEMIGALRTHQIDGFIAWEPFPAKAVTMGVGRVLISSGQIWKGHPCCALVCDERFFETKKDQAKALVRAHVKAIDFILVNREEAVQIAIKYTGMDETSVRLAMENVNYTPLLSVGGEKEYVDFLNKLKYIKVDDVDGFVNRFMRTEILKEIIKK